jgi:hypothetical protein
MVVEESVFDIPELPVAESVYSVSEPKDFFRPTWRESTGISRREKGVWVMRNVRFLWAVGIAVGVLLLSGQPIVAQEGVTDDLGNSIASGPLAPGNGIGSPLPEVNGPDTYGISGWVVHTLDCHGFHGYGGADYTSWASGYCGARTDSWNYFDTGVQLPTGAIVYGFTPYYYDDVSAPVIRYYLFRTKRTVSTFTTDTLWQHDSVGAPGIYAVYENLGSPYIWMNSNPPTEIWTYWFRAYDPVLGDSDTGFAGVSIWYKLQISPAPGTATFSDVPVGSFGFRHVEALVASGITSGCGGSLFCPNNTLTRVQMAVFLAKALGLHWPDA